LKQIIDASTRKKFGQRTLGKHRIAGQQFENWEIGDQFFQPSSQHSWFVALLGTDRPLADRDLQPFGFVDRCHDSVTPILHQELRRMPKTVVPTMVPIDLHRTGTSLHFEAELTDELVGVITAWPKLPLAIKAGITAMVQAAEESSNSDRS